MPKRLDIICQRFPYPPRRGDQLAVSKLIESAHAAGIMVRCYYVSGTSSHFRNGIDFIKMRFSIFRFIKHSGRLFIDHLQVLIFGGFKLPRTENPGIFYVHTIRMACTLPEEAWGSVSLAPQIDFALEFHERATAAKNPILRWLLKL